MGGLVVCALMMALIDAWSYGTLPFPTQLFAEQSGVSRLVSGVLCVVVSQRIQVRK